MRGKHVSFPEEQLITQTRNLVKGGTKEIILIAQDLTYYGLDIYKKRGLADLLRKISDVEGVEWIRLQYAYPSGFPTDILDVMAERDNICKYLDMPLQSGSDKVLKLMRRGITRQKTEDLVSEIRAKVPGISLRTTLIAGHPGEEESDFDETLDFVCRMRFDRLGVFTYSHEDQTHAYGMEDNVPVEEKQRRQDDIMLAQEEISFELNQLKVGHQLKVLIDKKEGDYFVGRTEFDSPEVDNEVLIEAKGNYLPIGHFAKVIITEATEFDLYGKVIQ
jgi:ribosomal protein S12 methylthiotransferase